MSRPNRRMLTLPSAQELTQGTDPIRLRKKKDRFLFMTYNLLAQALVRRDMFPHASQKALRWKFRRQNLLQEFLAFGPDLACLQEVDFWDEFYYPNLTKAGYETAYYKNKNKKHGCAIIWRKTRFEKVDQQTLEYDDVGQPTFMTGNIGLMVGLKPLKHTAENPDPNADMLLADETEDDESAGIKANGAEETNTPGGLLVATTHLFWRPDGSYERLRQASILLEKVKEWNQNLKFTVLLGGDFNTTPRDAAYRAMTRNEMPPHQIPNLEKWLVDEVTRVQQAEAEPSSKQGNSGDTKDTGSVGEQKTDIIDRLAAQTEKLGLEETSSVSQNGKTDGNSADLPYRAPPTGIMLPKHSAAKASAIEDRLQSTIVDPADFAASEDPKIKHLAAVDASGGVGGEDARVVAPLEAFTPPRNLMTTVEAHSRCISIYGQYEDLTKDNPAEVDAAAAAAIAAEESTATKAKTDYTHGEPVFTNFATWFKDTLDYVYLLDEPLPENGARLVPLRLLEIPDQSHLGHGLPNENFSSDHLCLMVEFAILAK
ncbi:hypothetical protein BGX27_004942 [Mortierella sp. AM989]|nr:hypothetical protein BGX27_004942 [Mortierella sp. AM989]